MISLKREQLTADFGRLDNLFIALTLFPVPFVEDFVDDAFSSSFIALASSNSPLWTPQPSTVATFELFAEVRMASVDEFVCDDACDFSAGVVVTESPCLVLWTSTTLSSSDLTLLAFVVAENKVDNINSSYVADTAMLDLFGRWTPCLKKKSVC